MITSAIDAWNNSVSSAAQISDLADTLSVIYCVAFIAMLIWLYTGLFESWSNQKIKGGDAIFMVGRSLTLMIFTFVLFSH